MSNVPFLPPSSPFVLPSDPFEQLMAAYGVQLQYMKGHECPCVLGNLEVPGSPDPACTTCNGRGTYWDAPSEPFFGLLTHIGRTNYGNEPGSLMDPTQGNVWEANPTITIPPSQVGPWTQATVYDAFIEPNAPQRFNTTLAVGDNPYLPYRQGLSIASTGAVRVYDATTHSVVSGVGYTVSSGGVFLADTYPNGTAYTVEYYADPVYVVFRTAGGAPHFRPLGAVGNPLPLRLHCQLLDIWTRSRSGSNTSTSPFAFGSG